MKRTYVNHLECIREAVSNHLRNQMDLNEGLKKFDSKKTKPFPEYRCEVELTTDKGLDGGADYATANICCFLEEINQSQQELVKQILEEEYWVSFATTGSWDDF